MLFVCIIRRRKVGLIKESRLIRRLFAATTVEAVLLEAKGFEQGMYLRLKLRGKAAFLTEKAALLKQQRLQFIDVIRKCIGL